MATRLGFNHIDLGTKDMEATRTFYEDLLGFPLAGKDDPVDATVAAIEPFAEVGAGQPVMTREEWEADALEF